MTQHFFSPKPMH